MKQNAQTVDSDGNAKIVTDYLSNEQTRDMQSVQEAYTHHKLAIQAQVSSIGDIVGISMPSENVGDATEQGKRELKNIAQKVDEFANQSVVDEITSLLGSFDSLIGYMDGCQTAGGPGKYQAGDLGKQPFYADIDKNVTATIEVGITEDLKKFPEQGKSEEQKEFIALMTQKYGQKFVDRLTKDIKNQGNKPLYEWTGYLKIVGLTLEAGEAAKLFSVGDQAVGASAKALNLKTTFAWNRAEIDFSLFAAEVHAKGELLGIPLSGKGKVDVGKVGGKAGIFTNEETGLPDGVGLVGEAKSATGSLEGKIGDDFWLNLHGKGEATGPYAEGGIGITAEDGDGVFIKEGASLGEASISGGVTIFGIEINPEIGVNAGEKIEGNLSYNKIHLEGAFGIQIGIEIKFPW